MLNFNRIINLFSIKSFVYNIFINFAKYLFN